MNFNKVKADDARNEVTKEAKAFIKQQKKQKKLKKKVHTSKSSNSVGVYEQAEKYIIDHQMKTRNIHQSKLILAISKIIDK